MSQQFYQVGGSLSANSKSYIIREADDKLYDYLKEGKYCYVLNARQVGKSSLRVHTSKRLEEEGYSCVSIDLSSIGSEDITADEWYFSFVFHIIEELGLDEDEFAEWWDDNSKLTVVNRFAKTFDKFVLKVTNKKIIIFIDEVDSILGIKKDFSADDFFAVIRTFYNLRSEDETYTRVSFALFGVATPEDLMRDSTRTPFNIAHSVKINQFKINESLMLAEGLADNSIDSQKILEKIFEWTAGTPYLTQKILNYISQNPISSVDEVDDIVNILFIQENFKETNISNILTRIMNNTQYNIKMLYIIDELIAKKTVKADDSRKQQIYLKLSGLVKEEKREILFSNKIYEKIFNKTWLNETIEKIDRPLTKDLQRWVELEKSTSALLKGDVLDKVREWADGREDISSVENGYLRLSVEEEQRSLLSEEKKKGQSKLIKFLIPALVLVSILGYYLLINSKKLTLTNKTLESINKELELEKNKSSNIEKILEKANQSTENNIKIKDENLSNEIKNQKSKEINLTSFGIPDWLKNDDNSTKQDEKKIVEQSSKVKKLLKDFDIKKEIKNKYPELIQLIYHTESMDDDERQYWFDIMSSMTESQIDRLYNILETEKKKLEGLEIKYQKEIKSLNKKHLIEWQEFQVNKLESNVTTEYIKDLNISEVVEIISTVDSFKTMGKMEDIISKMKNKGLPDNSYFYLMSELYFVGGRYEQGLKYIKKSYMIKPLDKYLLLEAKYYKKIKEYKNAILIYKKIIENYRIDKFNTFSEKEMKKIIDIYKTLSKTYKSDTNLEQAINEMETALTLVKKLVNKFEKKENLNKQYRILLEIISFTGTNEDYKKAFFYTTESRDFIENNKKILYKDNEKGYKKKLASQYNRMGWYASKTKDYNQAIKLYNKAIKLDSESSWHYRNIGIVYRDKKEYNKAITFIEKAIGLNPNYTDAYHSLGLTYSMMQEHEKAIKTFKKAFEINDESMEYIYPDVYEQYLIGNLPFNKTLDNRYTELYFNKKENFIYYEMLKIIQEITKNKEVNLDEWRQKYSNVLMEWDFNPLDEWIKNIKDDKIKSKLLNVLEVFKNHNKKEN